MYRGSDALNVCFNTVATLFVLDIDDLAYSQLVDEFSAATYEDTAVLTMATSDFKKLYRKRMCYPPLVLLVVFGSWIAVYMQSSTWTMVMFSSFLPLASISECIIDVQGKGHSCIAVVKAFMSALFHGVLGSIAVATVLISMGVNS